MKTVWTGALTIVCCALLQGEARAQLNGNNLRGDFGVGSGTQAAPGTYASLLFLNYDTDTIRDRDGEKLNTQGDIAVRGLVPIVTWVSKVKVLGANYGVMGAFPILNNGLEAPFFGLELETGLGAGDMYLQPMNLGWHSKRANAIAGVGLYLPTGRYDVDATDNTGLGMTTFELFGGTTVFLDEARSFSVATTAFWETHSEKKDTDTTVGDLLTLEGGVGKSFLKGAANVGLAYYAQWKLTGDDFGTRFPTPIGDRIKHKNFALGPDVTFPIATKQKLIALVNVRSEWEVYARNTSQGHMLVITATFPLPSIKLQP
jgi:hypothetical protein